MRIPANVVVFWIDIHRESFAKHLKSKNRLEIEEIIPYNFFIEFNESNKPKPKKIQP